MIAAIGSPVGAVQNAGQNRGRTLTGPASGLSLMTSCSRFERGRSPLR